MTGEFLGILLASCGMFSTLAGGLAVCTVTEFSPIFFSASMSLSAGVMVYVALVEMFAEALAQFEEALVEVDFENPSNLAYLACSIAFLVGWLASVGIDSAVHAILKKQAVPPLSSGDAHRNSTLESSIGVAVPDTSFSDNPPPSAEPHRPLVVSSQGDGKTATGDNTPTPGIPEITTIEANVYLDTQEFNRVGIVTALALALHNFPEGVMAYTGAIANPAFGIGLGLAVVIHNIPEGFAVAVPIYFGTGSRRLAVLYAFLSGLAELLGACCAWLMFQLFSNRYILSMMIASVGGIMTHISISELLVQALRFDPKDKTSTLFFFIGMAIMSMSLVGLNYLV